MKISWNGKKIKRIWFNGTNGDESITTTENTTLELEASYHGDRDEFWVKQLSNGNEIARFNCKYIASIEWQEG